MRGKVFIGFIALIIMSHIHATMAREKLYKKWTLKELLKYLDQLHLQYIFGSRILIRLPRSKRKFIRLFLLKTLCRYTFA
jgi:hypothetical protein